MMQKIRSFGISLLRAYDFLSDGCAQLAAWLLLGMTLIITYEVIVRYCFNRPTIWTVDFTDYIMLYTTFFASAWLLKHEGHVRLTLVAEHLSPRSQKVLEVITSFISALVCAFIIWYGVRDCWDAVENSITLPRPIPVPKYVVLVVIPFGCFLLLVQFIRNAFKILRSIKETA